MFEKEYSYGDIFFDTIDKLAQAMNIDQLSDTSESHAQSLNDEKSLNNEKQNIIN